MAEADGLPAGHELRGAPHHLLEEVQVHVLLGRRALHRMHATHGRTISHELFSRSASWQTLMQTHIAHLQPGLA